MLPSLTVLVYFVFHLPLTFFTSGGPCTASPIYPKKIKSREVKSGERGGQVIGQPLPIHFFRKLRFKKSATSLWNSGGASLCWNCMSSGPPSSKTGMRISCTWDNFLTTVSVALEVERFGNSNITNYKLDHITCTDAFSCHSSATRSMCNLAAKCYTFHVYPLCINYV